MDPSFGARLRAQRERQQVALTTIAERTKIRLSLLEELERDDVSHWPSGIFRRSYIRHYAQAVGLEPDHIVHEFLALYPDKEEEIPEVVAATRGVSVESPRQSPPTRLRFLLHSAIDAFPGLRFQPAHREAPAVPEVARPLPPPVLEKNNEKPAEEAPARVDLPAIARLCTRLSCALNTEDVTTLLEDAARILDAVGLTMWMADHQSWLTPVLAHGYPNGLAKLPHVPSDAHNAIATAFRSAEMCVVDGKAGATGAVVVPIMTGLGCAGVLAVELQHRREQHECVRAAAMILAAQLSTLVTSPALFRAATA